MKRLVPFGWFRNVTGSARYQLRNARMIAFRQAGQGYFNPQLRQNFMAEQALFRKKVFGKELK